MLTAQAPSADPTDAITPATKPTAPPEFLLRLSLSEERIQSSLNDSAEVAFTDTPLEEALKYLEDLHSVEIWLDKETLAAQQSTSCFASKPRWRESIITPVGAGITWE